MNQKNKTGRFGALLVFVVIVFLAILLHSIVSCFTAYVLVEFGVLDVFGEVGIDTGNFLLLSALISIPIGLLISIAFSKVVLKPVRDLISGMDQLACGNFKTRIAGISIMCRFPTFTKASESFNKMAQELESTEMLRNDFIDNFSHEFKTPIVSIEGFAKVLKHGNLTEAERIEYINVIEEESMRLAYMATNVLNLTKVENQTILTDQVTFNLSEQIRSCILLLENKWSAKNLDFDLDFGEYSICANEELLKQVWINLLDNAIKFSPENQEISVHITVKEKSLAVSISNYGCEIPEAVQKRIFQKFYQADESHSLEGNGVGLAIVKRILELHKGSISVNCQSGVTVFTVELLK